MIAPTQPAAIRGIVLRDERDTLIVQASLDEVQRFAAPMRGREVSVQPDVNIRLRRPDPTTGGCVQGQGEVGRIDFGDYLYDRDGKPVCVIRTLNMDHDLLETTSFSDLQRSYMRGALHIRIEAEGLPGVTLSR